MDDTLPTDPGILIIEDEALVARDIASRLRQLGYRVTGLAHSPKQAIERAEESQPDLLLCDIHLKDEIDGIEVARSITERLDIPVVFLTAYSDRETVSRAKSITPYGYVLKPIETPDLQIAIEMALHKFSIERELRHTRQLLETALQCIGDSLVFVDTDGNVSAMNPEAEHLFGLQAKAAIGRDCLRLLQEQAGIGKSASSVPWEQLLQAQAVTRLPPFQISREDGKQFLADGVVGPTRERAQASGVVLILRQLAEIDDPIDQSSMPTEIPDAFGNLYDYPQEHERADVLLLISPDNQEDLLHNLPVQARELLIQEIGEQLNLAMRSTDLASYYGGAIFSASLPNTSLEEANSIAGAIIQRLAQHWFLQDTLKLTLSIGTSHHRAAALGGSESPLELFRRANSALNLAQQSGGNRVAIWKPSTDLGLIGNLDSQSGLLTADAGQDYRNMALLWNTMSAAATSRDSSGLAGSLVNRIRRSFNLESAVFYEMVGQELHPIASDPAATDKQQLPASIEALLPQVIKSGEPTKGPEGYCIPLKLQTGTQGALFLQSHGHQAGLRQQDLQLVQSLFSYISGSTRRPSSSSLSSSTLPNTGSELLYQSDTMGEVLALIHLVAPTDETVLITGESGTGKEVIAREIHRLSKRSDKPFVIVDCGAVVSSLIERELFGHIKGSFTGAISDASGKLKEADGGTLLLDEIGELPLDVQVKLLRVVQEKQFTAVGSTRVETTNTRIIAATNVDLERQIKQGGFREDLFYRLNVFNVHSPPLRSRGEDSLHLARHFLESCSAQYERDIQGFTGAAEEAILRYPWPGNIRELRNKLIRAVILCQNNLVDVSELDLRRESDTRVGSASEESPRLHSATEQDTENVADLEAALRSALAAQVNLCLETGRVMPLGAWLEQDLIYAALEQHSQVNLQAAEALGLPESTLRRKLARYQADKELRPQELLNNWQPVMALLPRWIRMAQQEQLEPVRHLHNLLLSQIEARAKTQAEAAGLIGVTPPTYRRQLRQLADW